MSISYNVKLPAEVTPGQLVRDATSQSSSKVGFPSRKKVHSGYESEQRNTNENESDVENKDTEYIEGSNEVGSEENKVSLQPFPTNNEQVDDDAISASHDIQAKNLVKKRTHHGIRPKISLATLLKHTHRHRARFHTEVNDEDDDDSDDANDDDNDNDKDNEDDDGDDDDDEKDGDYNDSDEKTRTSELKNELTAPLPESVKNEIEVERLLKAARKGSHHRLKGKSPMFNIFQQKWFCFSGYGIQLTS